MQTIHGYGFLTEEIAEQTHGVKVNLDPEQQDKHDGRANLTVYAESFAECEAILRASLVFIGANDVQVHINYDI